RRALRDFAVRGDLAAVGGDQLARDREPEPAAARVSRLIEAREDVGQVLGRDPRAAVGDGDGYLAWPSALQDQLTRDADRSSRRRRARGRGTTKYWGGRKGCSATSARPARRASRRNSSRATRCSTGGPTGVSRFWKSMPTRRPPGFRAPAARRRNAAPSGKWW